MGGRGSSGGVSLAGAKSDLDYAQSMYSQAARRLNYTNSSEARTRMEEWSKELSRARQTYAQAEERERKRKRRRRNEDIPF